MSSLEGEILDGRYRVETELGRGGMGVVYRGTQLVLERPVAIKVLLGPVSEDTSALARFRREAVATGRLAHPGIVGIVDAGVHRGEPYLVMELVDGEPLDEVLARRGPLPVDEALSLARQLADALATAHESGVLHRDVKPANVLLAKDGRARLVDFGLAMLTRTEDRRLTLFGAFVGTPEYLAPEVARGEEPDARADVYALGATLYELLTCTVPFEGSNPIATVLAHFTGVFEPPSRRATGIPPEVDALVASLLARELDARPADARAALLAIDAVKTRASLESRSASAELHRPVVRARAPWTRRELDAVLIAALAGDGRSGP